MPSLAVEILSPNDTVEQINEKVADYLSAGVPLVWSVEPTFQTVMLYRSESRPELFNVSQQIPEHPTMPGFSPQVRELFE